MADSDATESAPWWESTPAGTPLLLAFVALGPLASDESPGLSAEERLRRHARLTAGVEYIAEQFGAAQPLEWHGDSVTLFIKGDAQHPAAVSAFAAAKMLLERIIVDLDQKARIAVHAAIVSWNPETGKLAHPAIELCGRLAHAAPVNGVAVIEDVYLELPEVKRRQLAALGLTAQDGVPAYVFPASLAARKDPRAFQPGDDLRLWETFRRYVNSPEIRRLRYVGFPLQKKQPPSLDIEEVFVPPEAEPWRWSLIAYLQRYDPEFLDVLVRNGQLELSTRPESIAETVKTRRSLVLLGDPGTGKTTVLRWLAVAAAGGPLAFERRVGSAERLLPLMVSVGRLSEIRTALKTGASVVDAIARYFHDRNVGDEDALRGFLQRRLDAGECLVLLDGLDEVRSDAREGIHRWLETFCAQYSRNRFVVSARQVGYAGFILPESHEVVLGPFNDEQVRRYTYAFERACRRWENNGIADDEAAKREADTLLAALFASPRLRDLARNPFLLSALVLIHRAEGALPRHRVQAYEVFSRTLCETWSSARRVVAGEERSRDIRYEEEAIPILGELALRMHEQWPSGVAPEEFVIETLSAAIRLREEGGAAERSAREFLGRAGNTVQILLERGHEQWGFLHLTFQEFFTAVGLLSSERFEDVAFEHLLDPRWEEVLRLGVGYMALVQKRGAATQRFVERVLAYRAKGAQSFLTQVLRKHVYLAALLAAEAGDVLVPSLQARVAEETANWLGSMPWAVKLPFLREVALTEFRARLIDVLVPRLKAEVVQQRVSAALALRYLDAERWGFDSNGAPTGPAGADESPLVSDLMESTLQLLDIIKIDYREPVVRRLLTPEEIQPLVRMMESAPPGPDRDQAIESLWMVSPRLTFKVAPSKKAAGRSAKRGTPRKKRPPRRS